MAQKLRKHGKKLEKTSVGCHIDFTILLSMLKVKLFSPLFFTGDESPGLTQREGHEKSYLNKTWSDDQHLPGD